jgi:hypothetical protein
MRSSLLEQELSDIGNQSVALGYNIRKPNQRCEYMNAGEQGIYNSMADFSSQPPLLHGERI